MTVSKQRSRKGGSRERAEGNGEGEAGKEEGNGEGKAEEEEEEEEEEVRRGKAEEEEEQEGKGRMREKREHGGGEEACMPIFPIGAALLTLSHTTCPHFTKPFSSWRGATAWATSPTTWPWPEGASRR